MLRSNDFFPACQKAADSCTMAACFLLCTSVVEKSLPQRKQRYTGVHRGNEEDFL